MPISYASKTLGKHDLNKPVIEKELLAIHWGIQFFRPYLYGRKFIVVTDHRPLVSLFSHKNPSSKLTRIRIDLSDYDFEIVYKKGKINTNANLTIMVIILILEIIDQQTIATIILVIIIITKMVLDIIIVIIIVEITITEIIGIDIFRIETCTTYRKTTRTRTWN